MATTIDRLFMEGLEQGPFFYGNQEAVQSLYEYKQLYLPEPQKNWDLKESQQRSHEIWATDELVWRTLTNPDEPFMDILDEFREELREALNRDGCCNDIFKAAIDTIDEIKYWITWEYA